MIKPVKMVIDLIYDFVTYLNMSINSLRLYLILHFIITTLKLSYT